MANKPRKRRQNRTSRKGQKCKPESPIRPLANMVIGAVRHRTPETSLIVGVGLGLIAGTVLYNLTK